MTGMHEDPEPPAEGDEVYVDNADVLEEYDLTGGGDPGVDDDDDIGAEDDGGEEAYEYSDGEEGDEEGGEGEWQLGPEVEDNASLTFRGHSGSVFCCAVHPTQTSVIASGGADDKAYLWSAADAAAPSRQLAGHADSVVSLAFSRDGKYLATGGLDGVVVVWDVALATAGGSPDAGLVARLEGPGEGIEWLEWHPRGHVLLAGSEDFTIWMWGLPEGRVMSVLAGHNGPVRCGGFTPDGRTIVSGSDDATLRIWDPKTGNTSHLVQGHPFHMQGLISLACLPDSSVTVTGAVDGSVRVTQIQTGKVGGALTGHFDSIESIGVCPGLPIAATASMDESARLWDLQTLTERAVMPHEGGVIKLVWHPSQPVLVTGCTDGVVRCWDGRTGRCERAFSGHRNPLLDVALSPDGRFVVSSSDDRTVKIFPL
eukprot:jgi/Mesvir1/13796/Mv15957-RA.1